MTVTIRRFGKARRLRSKKDLAKPSGHGKGKWHSRTTLLWAYKRLSRRRRLIAAASRRRNRGA